MSLSSDSDAALASQACGGDRHAFDVLVSRHKIALYRLARAYVHSGDDAYDIVQDSFIAAWLALRSYDPAKEFSTWLKTIALNKCRDWGRKQSVHRRLLRIFAFEQSGQSAASQQRYDLEQDECEALRLARLDEAIAALPAFYKEALLLTTISGLSQQAAAIQLNTTTKAIEMRLRRAKKKLKKTLADMKNR